MDVFEFERRFSLVPVGGLLVGVCDTEGRGLVQGFPDDLQRFKKDNAWIRARSLACRESDKILVQEQHRKMAYVLRHQDQSFFNRRGSDRSVF